MTDLPTSGDHRIPLPTRNLPAEQQLEAFFAFCTREGLDPTEIASTFAAFDKKGTTSLVADGAALAVVELLRNDEYVQRLEAEVDGELASTEKEDLLNVLHMLRDMIRDGDDGEKDVPTFQDRLAAGQEIRRIYQMSRSQRNRKRMLKDRERGGAESNDRLADLGRELLRLKRGGA